MFTIVKLNAINSTNSYLKEWSKEKELSHATVVVAKKQTLGRGEMGSEWLSESGKNLTFSILFRFSNFSISNQFYLNCAVSLSLYDSLLPIIGKNLTIKWPNDIMSANKKLGGILIENTVKSGFIKQSVIGIGLNVNQVHFPDSLPNAASLRLASNKIYDLDGLLQSILEAVKKRFNQLKRGEFRALNNAYQKVLYRRNVVSKFSDGKHIFNGKIIAVLTDGRLQIELENKELQIFSLKEIKYIF
ncbi:MAG: biotin--[acetyl-CoA-carboxylase] ligase [Flavobacteriaceae bacterium]|nr:biotin--[acetyl-CoA-carboxylase] ligase [Flavobacteriaceae bacterium]